MSITTTITEDSPALVTTRVDFSTTQLNREILVLLAKENNLPLAVFLEKILHGAVEQIITEIEAISAPETSVLFAELDKVLGTQLSRMVSGE